MAHMTAAMSENLQTESDSMSDDNIEDGASQALHPCVHYEALVLSGAEL